jgi:hypothetical protein
MTKLTKQGIRDLNSTPQNARVRSRQDACFHEWGHDPECYSCRTANDRFNCMKVCKKCLKVRA